MKLGSLEDCLKRPWWKRWHFLYFRAAELICLTPFFYLWHRYAPTRGTLFCCWHKRRWQPGALAWRVVFSR